MELWSASQVSAATHSPPRFVAGVPAHNYPSGRTPTGPYGLDLVRRELGPRLREVLLEEVAQLCDRRRHVLLLVVKVHVRRALDPEQLLRLARLLDRLAAEARRVRVRAVDHQQR